MDIIILATTIRCSKYRTPDLAIRQNDGGFAIAIEHDHADQIDEPSPGYSQYPNDPYSARSTSGVRDVHSTITDR